MIKIDFGHHLVNFPSEQNILKTFYQKFNFFANFMHKFWLNNFVIFFLLVFHVNHEFCSDSEGWKYHLVNFGKANFFLKILEKLNFFSNLMQKFWLGNFLICFFCHWCYGFCFATIWSAFEQKKFSTKFWGKNEFLFELDWEILTLKFSDFIFACFCLDNHGFCSYSVSDSEW